jgi:hypothetical protein
MVTQSKILIILLLISCISCVKDIPNPTTKSNASTSNKGVLLLNEGAYGMNNAEISFIDLEKKLVTNSIFKSTNNKSLGDVAQSMTIINAMYFIAVNNSSKIVVINLTNFSEIATIENVQFPRSILQISPTKAYVTSLYYPSISVLDLNTLKITNKITVDYNNTEQMILSNGSVYCTNWDTASNLLYKINPNTDVIEKRISLPGRASHSITKDKNGMLWILSGNKYKNKSSYLTCINPTNDSIYKSFAFPSISDPFRLTMNPSHDTLYFIQVNYNGGHDYNGIYRMSIEDNTLPSMAFIPAQLNSYYWAIGIDTATHHIFVSDPKGFSQQSTILEYTSSGQLIQQYQAGIGVNSFLFR